MTHHTSKHKEGRSEATPSSRYFLEDTFWFALKIIRFEQKKQEKQSNFVLVQKHDGACSKPPDTTFMDFNKFGIYEEEMRQ